MTGLPPRRLPSPDPYHDSRQQTLAVGGTGTVAQFSAEMDLTGTAFLLTRLFIEIFEESPEDGSRITHVRLRIFPDKRF